MLTGCSESYETMYRIAGSIRDLAKGNSGQNILSTSVKKHTGRLNEGISSCAASTFNWHDVCSKY
jgi:hypothetical protein